MAYIAFAKFNSSKALWWTVYLHLLSMILHSPSNLHMNLSAQIPQPTQRNSPFNTSTGECGDCLYCFIDLLCALPSVGRRNYFHRQILFCLQPNILNTSLHIIEQLIWQNTRLHNLISNIANISDQYYHDETLTIKESKFAMGQPNWCTTIITYSLQLSDWYIDEQPFP